MAANYHNEHKNNYYEQKRTTTAENTKIILYWWWLKIRNSYGEYSLERVTTDPNYCKKKNWTKQLALEKLKKLTLR